MNDLDLTVASSSTAPREARHALDAYQGEIEPQLLDDLRVLTTELVTNAARHAGGQEGDRIDVSMVLSSDTLHVQVQDQGQGTKPLRARSLQPPSGLALVATLSDRWASIEGTVRQVWFEIDVTDNGRIRASTALAV